MSTGVMASIIIGSMSVLTLAGLYVYKRRKINF